MPGANRKFSKRVVVACWKILMLQLTTLNLKYNKSTKKEYHFRQDTCFTVIPVERTTKSGTCRRSATEGRWINISDKFGWILLVPFQ